MKTLALEFSTSQHSVVVAEIEPGPVLSNGSVASILGTAHESGTNETKAFALIETALRPANWSPADIECIIVGLGPGSYTGIRVAISIAQGWQLARNVKLLGISTVECLAHQAKFRGVPEAFHIAIDAHRNEFYLASGSVKDEISKFRDSLRLAAADEIERLIASGETVIGPDLGFARARHLWPEAFALAEIAPGRTDFIRGEQLEPFYLRPTTFVKAPPPRVIR